MTRYFRSCLLLLAMIAACIVPATPAHAAGCYGDYCSGKDPQAMGCANDAVTTVSKNLSMGSLQIRWSPSCKTNWARMVIYPTGNKCFTYGTLRAKQDTGYQQSKQIPFVCGTYSETTYWTPMIYSPVRKVRGEFYNQQREWEGTFTAWS